jgi:hypothetical protein
MRGETLAGIVIGLALLAAGCAGGFGGSSADLACPAPIEAPVLYPGDGWIFRSEDGKRWGQRYDQVTPDGLLRGRGPKPHVEYYYDHAHTLRKVYSNGTWLTQETRDFPDIGFAELAFPLVPGKTWSLALRDPSFAMVVHGYIRVAGCEEVTVPAGRFLAIRLDFTASFSGVSDGHLAVRYWYAPAVKNKVKQAFVSGQVLKEFAGYELEFFTIDSGKPATP